MKIPFVSNLCANWTCSNWFYNTPLSYGNLPDGTAERASTYFAWAPGVNYVIGDTRWETNCAFLCFAAHLSAAGNRPIYGASHTDFWRPRAAIGWSIPCAGTFSHLLMKPAGGALGVGNTVVGMLTRNWIDTALTFTLGAADLSASDLVHSVAVSAGDYVQLSLRGVGTGALFSPNYAVLFEPTIPGLQPFMGYNYYETGKVCNGSLEGSYYYNGGELAAQCVVPFSGKFKYMWMDWHGPGMAAGSTATQTLRVNGVDSALALTFTGGESRLVSKKSDLVTEVAVNAGDMVSFRTTGTGVSGAFWIKHSICFIPDDPHVWFRVRSAGYQALTGGAIAYSPASLGTFFFGSTDWAAAEVPTIWPKSDVKITGVAARCTAPGVGAGRKFDVYHKHASAATVTVSGANVFNLSSGYDIQPNDFDTLCVSNERVGLPSSDRGSIAILGGPSVVQVPLSGYLGMSGALTAWLVISVETDPATNILAHEATLNGDLTSIGVETSLEVYFEYGTVSGVYTHESVKKVVTETGEYNVDVSDLQDDTTYYFRAVADTGSIIVYGAEESFDTNLARGTLTKVLGIPVVRMILKLNIRT